VQLEEARGTARRAGRGEGVEWLGRVGLVAQGVIYVLIGVLAAEVAIDGRDSSEQPDKTGALRLVADQPFGTWLLSVLGIGLAAFALWRVAQAVVDREGKGDDASGLATRAGYLAIGLVYAALAVLAFTIVLGGKQSAGGSGGSEQKATAGLLGLPLGRELVFAVAAGFLAAAGWNAYRALGGDLDKHLKTGEMSKAERKTAVAIGAVGYLARAAVFGLIATFLAKAALEFDPKQARSLDGALLELAQQPYGPVLLALVAAGLTAFGLWCVVQARYREL